MGKTARILALALVMAGCGDASAPDTPVATVEAWALSPERLADLLVLAQPLPLDSTTVSALVDEWLVTGIQGSRGASTEEVAAQVAGAGGAPIKVCSDVAEACRRAAQSSVPGDRVVVFGSFHVVGPALEVLGLYSPPSPAQEDHILSR
jgi:hypothetical protein